MRKVLLNMKTQEKYEIIKKLIETDSSKEWAAVKIGCTLRNVNRLILKYKKEGKAGFLHGNTGRKPSHTLSETQRTEVITLYNNKYWDANFTHACELLQNHDGISISPSTLKRILFQEYVISPKAKKCTRKNLNILLKNLHSQATSKKEKKLLEACMVASENAHSRRPRCSYFGEMLQMDASLHLWFGSDKTQLHIAVDDATGCITGAYFDQQETLNGYYHVLCQTLTDYGIPHMFYTDKRTVFEYQRKNIKAIEQDTFTQFGYACHQLGIDIKTTSVAQAKGRVERLFQTLQSRLPVELRLKGIKTLSEANVFLNSYIKEYNAKFTLPLQHIKSIFISQPDSELINQTLAIVTERTVDNGHCIKFQNKYYKTMDAKGLQVYFHKGVKGMVIHTFDGTLLFSTNDKVYVLDEIPSHEYTSRNFDYAEQTAKPVKRNIPTMKHPWRSQTFWKYAGYHLPESDHTV